jgi:diadenosine tetraphosphatase ApaH/serine/threonine PP2A family protein phosphatase
MSSVKRAILSDIHSNIEALNAVLDDARQQGAEQFVCLGDIIGYGPNPGECIDLAMKFDLCVLGNHDQGALFDPEGFSRVAERAIFWTRSQLENAGGDEDAALARLDFLADLPRQLRDNGSMFVHGSPRNPLNEYVFPEDVYNTRKLEKVFSLIGEHCFVGHTHVPGVFPEKDRFISPDQIDGQYVLSDTRAIVNVGSVGQPRDGDCRSCYVLLEDNVVTFRRVEYPLDETIEKIYAVPELENFLGDRLRTGQ